MDNIDKVLEDKENLCIFVGAGASILAPASLPSFFQLNSELIDKMSEMAELSASTTAQLKKIHTKPEQLLQIIWDNSRGEINPVAGFQFAQPNKNHALISRLAKEGVRCIVTTNFDPCLEHAMKEQEIPFSIFYDTNDNECMHQQIVTQLKEGKRIIWKPHGDCRDKYSLCYSKRNVSRLRSSITINSTMRYITANYNILFLGYSGYDDDLFPIIYDSFIQSNKIIIWNSYSIPSENAPVSLLKEAAPNRLFQYIGDMLTLLEKTVNQIVSPHCKDISCPKNYWINSFYSQISKFKKSFSASVLSKYAHIMDFLKEADEIWKQGLSLSTEDISEEDSIRFKYNLGQISSAEAYRLSRENGYYQIAEIALRNLITSQKQDQDFVACEKSLVIYGQNCCNEELKAYFSDALYLLLKFELYKAKQNNLFPPETEGYHKELFWKTYNELIKNGYISEACLLSSRFCNHLAALHTLDIEILNTAIAQYEAILPYNEIMHLCELSYCIANIASSLGKMEVANRYNTLSFEYLRILFSQGGCDQEYYNRICSILYQQEALILPSGVNSCLKGINYAERMTDQKDKCFSLCILYSTLASCYRFSNWSLCQKYGQRSFKYAIRVY